MTYEARLAQLVRGSGMRETVEVHGVQHEGKCLGSYGSQSSQGDSIAGGAGSSASTGREEQEDSVVSSLASGARSCRVAAQTDCYEGAQDIFAGQLVQDHVMPEESSERGGVPGVGDDGGQEVHFAPGSQRVEVGGR